MFFSFWFLQYYFFCFVVIIFFLHFLFSRSFVNLSFPRRSESKFDPIGRYQALRRRNIRDTTSQWSSARYAKKAETKKRQLATMQAIQKEARAKTVAMFRKYRVGELPDIQIKYADVITPLQALACSDTDIARTLFVKLAISISSSEEVCFGKE